MGWFDSGWGLASIVALPLAGAAVVGLSQPKSEDLIKGVAFFTALSTFMLSVLAARRLSPEPGEEIVIDAFLGGIPGLADRYYITDFGIRLPILVLFGFLATIVAVYSYKQWRRPSHAKAIIMATLVILDVLMLEVIFEEGTPPVPASALVLAAIDLQPWQRISGAVRKRTGRAAPGVEDGIRVSCGSSGPHPTRRYPADVAEVIEEEMSGLVR